MSDSEYSKMVLDIIPPVMRYIRSEMRILARSELTVPQFRVLARLSISTATNRDLAEWIGVSAPTMTRMVDSLVRKGMVQRDQQTKDRRQVQLFLTEKGQTTFQRLREGVRGKIADKVGRISMARKTQLKEGLTVLREIFL